jgi:acyl carrier protein
MIPSAFVQLYEMPLSSHGKIDFNSLPAPATSSHLISANSSPSSKTEELISQAWCEVLGCETIQKTDNFFDIGGNSLLILQVFKKIERILPKNCQVIDLFKYPTIETLVTYVADEVQDKNVGAEKIIERAAKQKLATLNKANRKKVGSNKARLNQPLKVE